MQRAGRSRNDAELAGPLAVGEIAVRGLCEGIERIAGNRVQSGTSSLRAGAPLLSSDSSSV
jgi:hypothetical protein